MITISIWQRNEDEGWPHNEAGWDGRLTWKRIRYVEVTAATLPTSCWTCPPTPPLAAVQGAVVFLLGCWIGKGGEQPSGRGNEEESGRGMLQPTPLFSSTLTLSPFQCAMEELLMWKWRADVVATFGFSCLTVFGCLWWRQRGLLESSWEKVRVE